MDDTSEPIRAHARHRNMLPLSLLLAVLQASCGGGGSGGGGAAIPLSPAPAPSPAPPAPAPAPAPPPALSAAQACDALKSVTLDAPDISLPTRGATIATTTLVAPSGTGPTAVGEYCRVTGAIAPVDRTAPPIQFNLALPTEWNNKAIQLMGGGYDGNVVAGSGNTPGSSGLPTPLARGYAGFGSDSGHSGSALEASFGLNQEALENYLGDQLRKTRDVAVNLIQKRYGHAPTKTYAAGGSGGGREALYVADRWPGLYDGVIAYYPAWSLTAMLTNYTAISKALAAPGAWSNPTKQSLLKNAVVASCDALDGAVDGVVSHVAACTFTPQSLRCAGGADAGDTCLSDAQITGFSAYTTPLAYPYTLSNGINSYPAFNIFDGGLLPAMGSEAPSTPSNFNMPFAFYIGESFVRYFMYGDPSYDSLQFNLNANGFAQQRQKYLSSRQDVNPDMSGFFAKGGKVLIVHGMADPLIPASSSREFFNRAVVSMGAPAVNASLKYYEVPGYAHGSGDFNLSFDSLGALERWVEGSSAPTAQIGRDANPANGNRTRPMCEFPTWPRYNGIGDVNLASSFTCTH